jgi:signal transduction histidine kinase/ActR/RegA family two-component response regulator
MLSTIRRSLRAKIVSVVLWTTLVALAVSATALLLYETRNYGAFLVSDAMTQAEILADITAPALVFDDPAAAAANLKPLARRREIEAAAVYAKNGDTFATFSRTPEYVFPPLGPPGTTVEGTALSVFQPVTQNGEVIGTVFLRSSYGIANRLRDYFLILMGVMLPSFAVAAFLSLWLARSVTNPLETLTGVARHVVEHRDFTRRAPRTTNDEVGVFVDAFNTMLAEVGRRAEALEQTNRALQQETDERRLAEIALRRADQRKDEFLATLAHELRNPLAPMVNAVTLLESPHLKPEMAAPAHGVLRRQLAQLVRLVDDLLDVSRITSGKLVIRKEPIELSQVVNSAVETARPLLDQRSQRLTVDLPAQPVRLHGDLVRLSQVLSNLLNNAAKYSEPGTEVSLSATVTGDRVRVKIADQGIGIAPESLGAIFGMFSQAESAQTAQTGLGVGLALARRLVELHGGTIEAESLGKGHGSVFAVTLPIDTAATTPVAEARPAPAAPATSRRILLVDDNVDFARSMSILLQRAGHRVGIAHDAAGALTLARELQPEIGFLDIGLPGVNGHELAGMLRAQPESAATVLVAVSGWGQPSDRERSRQAGFALHIVKPVEFEKMLAAVAELVPAT